MKISTVGNQVHFADLRRRSSSPFLRQFVVPFPQSAALRRTIPAHFNTPNPYIFSHHTHYIFSRQIRTFASPILHISLHHTLTFCHTVPWYSCKTGYSYKMGFSWKAVVHQQNGIQLQSMDKSEVDTHTMSWWTK